MCICNTDYTQVHTITHTHTHTHTRTHAHTNTHIYAHTLQAVETHTAGLSIMTESLVISLFHCSLYTLTHTYTKFIHELDSNFMIASSVSVWWAISTG